YASSKGLVTFFALLALERYLALREAPAKSVTSLSWQFGLFSAATVMTHSGFLGFPLALFALFAWDTLRRRRRWRDLLLSTSIAALVAIPWYVWAIAQYGLRAGVFVYPHAPYDSVLRWAFDRFLIVSLVETIAFELAVLWWAWSPAGGGRPNALVAQANHLRFLGQDTLPIGIILLIAGIVLAVVCVWPHIRAQAEAPSRASSPAAA